METLAQLAYRDMDALDFVKAMQSIKEIVDVGNEILNANEFWTLIRPGGDKRLLENLIFLSYEVTRVASLLLLPVCPELAT